VREICKHGSEGGAAQLNAPFLPLSGGRAWSASPRRLFRRMAVRMGKSSLRRKKVVRADRAGSGPTGGRGRGGSESALPWFFDRRAGGPSESFVHFDHGF
jgi:hypothetical protein